MTKDKIQNSPRTLDGMVGRAEQFARKEPTRAVVSAFGAGLVLNLVPVGAIVSILVGIALSLIRPALFLLGLLKAYELCNRTTSNLAKP